ncbi:hypothetical protein [Actinomyces ruminicola]|uniref:Uncharacterized protein n=1 Tax=Actinomyces ruminicola TaxID=332524 RepID=A0A1G9TQB6_9ACTO|nr:hypothetical protein [Actinomyces ruminicola]SDM49851.1 hypothetical protein SAMN04487766_10390 [Actinomyces ruminicola]
MKKDNGKLLWCRGKYGAEQVSALGALYEAQRSAERDDQKVVFEVLSVIVALVAATGVIGSVYSGEVSSLVYALLGFSTIGIASFFTQLLAVTRARNESIGILEERLVAAAKLADKRKEVGWYAEQRVNNVGFRNERRNALLWGLIPLMYLIGFGVAVFWLVPYCAYKLWSGGGCLLKGLSILMGIFSVYVILAMIVVLLAFAGVKTIRFLAWAQ